MDNNFEAPKKLITLNNSAKIKANILKKKEIKPYVACLDISHLAAINGYKKFLQLSQESI